MSEPWSTILTLLVGLITGILSGMFGVGGAVISQPALRALGVPALVAVGTTLPSIIPSAISGSLRYQQEQLIRPRVVAWTAGFGVAAAVAGAALAPAIPGEGHLLLLTVAVLVGWTAVRLARGGATGPEETGEPLPVDDATNARPHATPAVLGSIGVVAGGLSGLLGIGGGIFMVPGFVAWAKLGIKEAVATSLACVGIFAVPGTITHAIFGRVDWSYAIPLAIAVIPGARIGAGLAIRASDRRLRIAVAAMLAVVSVIYAVGELVALTT
ncbi:MAG: sulfite exporter TauE/SafE family protein [Acidimicrobiia bacterium]